MTPARQPQQDYLSITSEELLIIEHGCIYPDKDECIGKHCKYHDPNPSFRDNIVCLLNEHDVADLVRSRPHTSPPAPAFKRCCDSCINVPCKVLNRVPCLAQEKQENTCEENGCADVENCDEICQHSRLFSPLQMQEAKQVAAKAEREQVLDEICRINTEDNVCKKGKDCKSCLVQSLRSKQEQR